MLEDLGFTDSEVFRRRVLYSTVQFSTSVKPRLLRVLLNDHNMVTYFDPDIRIYKVLELEETIFTPHTLSPGAAPRRFPGPDEFLISGICNLGFISVTKSPETGLEWWDAELRPDSDVRPGFAFYDQKAAERLPAFVEAGIVRDPG